MDAKAWIEADCHPTSVFATEAFSRLKIATADKEHGFKFHSKLEKLKLNHLCYANDLMVFTNADIAFIKIVKSVLEEFKALSTLQANCYKS